MTAAASEPTAFDRAIAVAAAGPGSWRARVDAGWSVPRGPNGGYLAAIVLRAMEATLDDPRRPPRSLTCHYLRPPREGVVRVEVAVERAGRAVSTLTARLRQEDRLCVLAVGAFAPDLPSAADWAPQAPQAPPPEALALWQPAPGMPPIAQRLEMRAAIGAAPFTAAGEASTGGWIALREPRATDAAALALYADAWLPAAFARLHAPVAAPTIDLTIHFRDLAAAAALAPGEPVLGAFRSVASTGGFFEEDGELWSRDGVLLAHSRQLALLVPDDAL